MITTYHRTEDGKQVREQDALDDRGQLRDGFTMRNKLTLMDGAPPKLEHQRRERLARYDTRISKAWRNPVVDYAAEARVRDAALARITDPYERYERRLQDAWRS